MARETKQKIYVKTLAKFNELVKDGTIVSDHLVFIENTQQIWTHGKFFSAKGFKSVSDGTNQASAADVDSTLSFTGTGKATVTVGATGVTINASNATVATGDANGQVKIDGQNVSVKGLGSAAYTESSAYDAKGDAAAVLGASTDAATANTVYGAKAAAKAAQDTADAAVVANTEITGATKCKITYDSKGLVTAGSDLEASDIPELTLSKISDKGTAASKNVATTAIAAESTDTNLVTAQQVAAFVKGQVADLTGAMHFLGALDAAPSAAKVTIDSKEITAKAGDVVIVASTSKEYVYNGSSWVELGDESHYVLKTATVAGVDLQDNITKDELLTALNVADGAQVNVLEGVQFNGTNLTVTDKKVNVQAATTTQGGYADSALQSISKGTDGDYVTTTVSSKSGDTGSKGQTVAVSVTTQTISSQATSGASNGLVTASDAYSVTNGLDTRVTTLETWAEYE